MNLTTILVSAGTSVLVTLLIEFFAKPYLEARKDRILDRYRAQRTVQTACGHILAVASALATSPRMSSQEEQRILNEEFNRLRQELYEQAEKVKGALMSHGYAMTDLERNTLAKYCSVVQGLSISQKLRSDMAREAVLYSSPIVDYLFPYMRVRRLIQRLTQRFGKSRKLQQQLTRLGWGLQNDQP